MKKILFQMFIVLFILVSMSAFIDDVSADKGARDGPYIFFRENAYVVNWIENGKVYRKNLNNKNFREIRDKFNLKFSYGDLNELSGRRLDEKQTFTGIDSICAISDIHGEFSSYTAILKAQGIIDKSLNWSFGTGHLIVLGDYFDRGDRVNELLWHLFGLQKQAEKAGGKVHIMLGNHEMLLFSNDTRYTNDKYLKASQLLELKYSEMYSMQTVLGKWIRSQPVMIRLNDCMFVHGGISAGLLEKNLKTDKINKLFSEYTLGKEINDENEINDLMFLTENEGPIWYRGFFTANDFTEDKANSILLFYGVDHIIVGHTSDNEMKSLFNNKIVCIDAGLGNNLPGAVLIWKNKALYKGTADGKRTRL